jgi:hypothetical protein
MHRTKAAGNGTNDRLAEVCGLSRLNLNFSSQCVVWQKKPTRSRLVVDGTRHGAIP